MKETKTGSSLIPESFTQFYRRMAKAFRSAPPPEAVAIALLSRVVELHHRMAAAIQVAVDRSDPGRGEQLLELCNQETRLAHAVGDLVTELGGSPPRPEESSEELPHDLDEMSCARDQSELVDFVSEDLEWVAKAHVELTYSTEIPIAMRRRLTSLHLTNNRISSL